MNFDEALGRTSATTVDGSGSRAAVAVGALPGSAARPRTATPPPQAEHPTSFRPDIQGLRAVAVVLVVLDHFYGRPTGGYVGVDVFFVISGYLITGNLLREHARTGRISWRGFYVHRTKRILPAALFTLVVTVVVARALFTGARAHQTLVDALWSAIFLGNVRFANVGTDYFDSSKPQSALQHYWSLAVEEQFYVVWPIVLIVVLAVVARVRLHRAVAVCGVLTVLSVASLLYGAHVTATSPVTAYFSTPARAWELGIGALVATAATLWVRVPVVAARLLAWAGLAGLVASAFVLDETSPMPVVGAVAPVLFTAVLLAFGGTGGTHVLAVGSGWALGSRPFQYVGLISFSLYLWHWPVIVVGRALTDSGSLRLDLMAPLAALTLTLISYHLVENPVRNSVWLLRGRARTAQAQRRFDERLTAVQRWNTTLAVLVLVLAVAVAGLATAPRPPTAIALPVATTSTAGAAADPLLTDLQATIRASVSVTAWGTLTPSLDDIDTAGAPEWKKDQCLNVDDDATLARCVYGDRAAPRTAVLLGDSIAISLVPGLRVALGNAGYKLQILTRGECPLSTVATEVNGVADDACVRHHAYELAQVAAIHPDLLIMSDALTTVSRVTADDKIAAIAAGMPAVLAQLAGHADRTVFISTPPGSGNLQSCVTALSSPQDCMIRIGTGWQQFTGAEKAKATAAGIEWLDVSPWFCVAGYCPAVIGSTPAYVDGNHMTAAYSTGLAPLLGEALT